MRHPDIPRLAYRFFKWFCKETYFEELQGDLEEVFEKHRAQSGLASARRRYVIEVIKMLRPSVVKRVRLVSAHNPFSLMMSYAVLALRNLRRYKLFFLH